MTSKHKIALVLSTVVSLTGFAVMAVYMLGFVSQRDAAVNMAQNIMSFSSAVCFFLSGVAFYYIARVMEGEVSIAQVVLSITFLMIVLFISIHLVFMVMGGDPSAGIRQSLGAGSYDILDQAVLLHPSLESIFNFFLVSVVCFVTMVCAPCRTGTPCFGEKNYFIGMIIIFVSAVALLDRFLNLSQLMELPNKPMGIVSFGMFLLLGAGMMTVCRSR